MVYGPERMIVIPPNNYCVVENPVLRDGDGSICNDKYGQVK